jgi:hypothetical protein
MAVIAIAVNANAQMDVVRINNTTAHIMKVQMVGLGVTPTCTTPTTITTPWFNVNSGTHSYGGTCNPFPGFIGCVVTNSSHITWTQISVKYWPGYTCIGTVLPSYSIMTLTGCGTLHKGRWIHMTTSLCGIPVGSGWERIRLS